MDIKVRMMTAQTSAVNEERQGGGARLAAKQVRKTLKLVLDYPQGSGFPGNCEVSEVFLGVRHEANIKCEMTYRHYTFISLHHGCSITPVNINPDTDLQPPC